MTDALPTYRPRTSWDRRGAELTLFERFVDRLEDAGFECNVTLYASRPLKRYQTQSFYRLYVKKPGGSASKHVEFFLIHEQGNPRHDKFVIYDEIRPLKRVETPPLDLNFDFDTFADGVSHARRMIEARFVEAALKTSIEVA